MNNILTGIYQIIKNNLFEILSLRSTGVEKEDGTYVSQGDLLCQKLIINYLKIKFPDCILISEEMDVKDITLNKVPYVAVIDPIDGTENFVSGLKEWGFGVSLYKNGRHYQSILGLPELDICLCTGDKLNKIKNSRICGLSSYMTQEDFSMLQRSNFEYRIMGCCMYNMYNVIKGSYQQFQNLKGAYAWDILPGINLALENGLIVEVNDELYKGEFLKPGIKYKFKVSNI